MSAERTIEIRFRPDVLYDIIGADFGINRVPDPLDDLMCINVEELRVIVECIERVTRFRRFLLVVALVG